MDSCDLRRSSSGIKPVGNSTSATTMPVGLFPNHLKKVLSYETKYALMYFSAMSTDILPFRQLEQITQGSVLYIATLFVQ